MHLSQVLTHLVQAWGAVTAIEADPTIAGVSLMFMTLYFMIVGCMPDTSGRAVPHSAVLGTLPSTGDDQRGM